MPASAASRSAAASSVIRKFDAIDAAAWYAGRSVSSISTAVIPSADASEAATASARRVLAAIAAPAPANAAPSAVTVISGCSENASCGRQHVERRRAGAVPDETARRNQRGRGADLRIRHAQQHSVGSGAIGAPAERARDVNARIAQRVCERVAEAALANDRQAARGVVGGEIPFQFSHSEIPVGR